VRVACYAVPTLTPLARAEAVDCGEPEHTFEASLVALSTSTNYHLWSSLDSWEESYALVRASYFVWVAGVRSGPARVQLGSEVLDCLLSSYT